MQNDQNPPEFLSIREQAALMAQPDIRSPAGLRNCCALRLLLHLGLRLSELLSLRWEQTDIEHGLVKIDKHIAEKPRMLFLTQNDSRCLRQWNKIQELHTTTGRGCEYICTTLAGNRLGERYIQKFVTRYAGEAALAKQISPTTLRNTFAVFICKLLNNQVKIAREALGFSTLSAVKRYVIESEIFPADPEQETLYRDIVSPYLEFVKRYRSWNSYVHLSGYSFSRKWLFDLVKDLPDWILEEDLQQYV